MAINFNCPACGAPMEYDGETTLFQNCKTCGAPIVIPAEVVDANRKPPTIDDAAVPDSNVAEKEISISVEPTPLEDPKIIANARILEETNAGNKIAAVKLYREAFATDLQTAKEAIETLESEIAKSKQAQIDVGKETISVYESDQTLKQIYTELSAGRKIEAIKVFREKFNTGLKEAKEAVEALERGEKINMSIYT